MKKLLSLFGALGLIATSGSTVASCDLSSAKPNDDNNNADTSFVVKIAPSKIYGEKGASVSSTEIKYYDFLYKDADQYKIASDYYLNDATSVWKMVKGMMSDQKWSEVWDNQLVLPFYFNTIWEALEGQWDLVKVVEAKFFSEYNYFTDYENYESNELITNKIANATSIDLTWMKETKNRLIRFKACYTSNFDAIDIKERPEYAKDNVGNKATIYGTAAGAADGFSKYLAAANNENPNEFKQNDINMATGVHDLFEQRENMVQELLTALETKIAELEK